LRKDFGAVTVLDIDALTIEPGTVTAFIGPNGAGKTTLVKLISGIWAPTRAKVLTVFDEPVDQSVRRRSTTNVGVVVDSSQLFGMLTVEENVDYMARLYHVPKADRAERVRAALEACGITDRAHDRAWTLSTGLKQRANIARALVTKPRLLLLDEPTSGLDPVSAEQVYDTILALRGAGITVVACTHIMAEVSDLSDRVLFINHGKVVADGSPTELLSHVGRVVHTIRLPQDRLDQTRAQLLDHGVKRTVVRRDEQGVLLTALDCPDSRVLESLGFDFERRAADLRDAFLVLAGD
jgi:ABC-type multidrug transport system ATPase subunit